MDLIKKNKGAILFYLLIIAGCLLLSYNNKKSVPTLENDTLINNLN